VKPGDLRKVRTANLRSFIGYLWLPSVARGRVVALALVERAG